MLRTTSALEGLGLTAAVFLGTLLMGFALDNLLWFSAGTRLILLLAGIAAVGTLFFLRIVRPLTRGISDERAAVVLEKAYPNLDNAVINAVQLGKDKLDDYSRLVADEVVKDANSEVTKLELPGAVEKRNLKRYSIAAGIACAAIVIYVVLFPAYFANAFQRYASFMSDDVMPITKTKIDVKPGNTTIRSGEDLVVTCTPSGNIPDSAEVQFGEGSHLSMQYDAGKFLYTLPDVTEDLEYVVYAGDARSRTFKVKVIYVPTIETVNVTYRYPKYTGIEDKKIENTTGDLEAVEGTMAFIRAECSKPVSFATYNTGRGPARVTTNRTVLTWTMAVNETGTYALKLRDENHYENSYTYHVTALKDKAPKVVITRPGRDLTFAVNSGKHRLPINFRASDDLGVRECVLLMSYGGSEPVTIRTWKHAGGTRDVSTGHVWEIDTDKMKIGETVSYCVAASDGRPGEEGRSASKTYKIAIVKERDKRRETISSLYNVHSKLREMLKLQIRNRDRTADLGKLLEKVGTTDSTSKKSLERIHRRQKEIRDLGEEIAQQVSSASEYERSLKETLLSLSANEMLEAIRELEKGLKAQTTGKRVENLKSAVQWEEKIIAALQKLLTDVAAMRKQLRKGEDSTAELEEEDLNLKKDLARNFVDGLEEFLKQQKKIIKMTEELEKKAVEDWTAGDEKILAELERIEQDWSKWFKDMKDDLSRLPPQDFSDSSICDEIMEIYEEVELAKDALTRREIELAVPHEQAGLEKAEELTTNLERWLPDVRDYVKWVMEDVPEDQEIPLTDLPDELEDIIGDLIEEEDQLSEDADDVSSAWADSLDKGAGWGTSDGPISNMSAKGVTGNTLPNTNEVGGRSGEGRSGKASGQMVEKTATGKGGRKTPTRLTPDPFEEGVVEDTSKDPTGGSTGGGKLSGGGEEGLRGPTAPQLKEQMQRLARQQAQIMSKSDRLAHNLKKASLPSGDLGTAVSAMQGAEKCLKNLDLNGFAKYKKIAVDHLEDAKKVVASEVRAKRERALAIPKDVREEIINAQKEKFPEKYKGLLSDYYKVLSNAGSNGKK
jgi:hypothetical protein